MHGWEGFCPECGLRYLGWALVTQRNQLCIKCGSALQIRKDGVIYRHTERAAFKAEEYVAGLDQDKWEDLRDKNLLFYLSRN